MWDPYHINGIPYPTKHENGHPPWCNDCRISLRKNRGRAYAVDFSYRQTVVFYFTCVSLKSASTRRSMSCTDRFSSSSPEVRVSSIAQRRLPAPWRKRMSRGYKMKTVVFGHLPEPDYLTIVSHHATRGTKQNIGCTSTKCKRKGKYTERTGSSPQPFRFQSRSLGNPTATGFSRTVTSNVPINELSHEKQPIF